MDPNFLVVRTMSALIWMMVAMLLLVLIVFGIVALVNLISILKSTNKMVKQLERKTDFIDKILDGVINFVSQKLTAFFNKEKTEKE